MGTCALRVQGAIKMAPRSDFWDRFVSVGHVGYFWRFRRGPNFAASRGVELLAVSHVSP